MKGKLKVFGLFGVALFCAATFIAPQTAFADKKGQDYPNEKCQRNNKDGSTTTGQCSSVCKDLTVSTTKDVNSGLRTCKQARIVGGLVGHGGLVAASAGSGGVAYATTSINCGGDHYDVSTGNNAGKCTTNRGSKNEIESGGCDDGQGNGASFTCKDGFLACNSSGSGSCKFVPSK